MRALFDEISLKHLDVEDAGGLVVLAIFLLWMPFASPFVFLTLLASSAIGFVTSRWGAPLLESVGLVESSLGRLFWIAGCTLFCSLSAVTLLQAWARQEAGRKALAWLQCLSALVVGPLLVLALFPPPGWEFADPLNFTASRAHVAAMLGSGLWLFQLQYDYRIHRGYSTSWW